MTHLLRGESELYMGFIRKHTEMMLNAETHH